MIARTPNPPAQVRRALVTGASGAIGGAIARALAADGLHVLAHANTNRAAAEALVFPVEAHTRPRAPPSRALDTATTIPRSLKEPVGFSPSHLAQSSIPKASSKRRHRTRGVLPSPRVSSGVAAVRGNNSPYRAQSPSPRTKTTPFQKEKAPPVFTMKTGGTPAVPLHFRLTPTLNLSKGVTPPPGALAMTPGDQLFGTRSEAVAPLRRRRELPAWAPFLCRRPHEEVRSPSSRLWAPKTWGGLYRAPLPMSRGVETPVWPACGIIIPERDMDNVHYDE